MSPARPLLVILMSLAVVLVSGAGTYLVWSSLAELGTVSRDVVSLLSWVVTFFIGTFFMWRGVLRLSRSD